MTARDYVREALEAADESDHAEGCERYGMMRLGDLCTCHVGKALFALSILNTPGAGNHTLTTAAEQNAAAGRGNPDNLTQKQMDARALANRAEKLGVKL